jgi:hypothetical protein
VENSGCSVKDCRVEDLRPAAVPSACVEGGTARASTDCGVAWIAVPETRLLFAEITVHPLQGSS